MVEPQQNKMIIYSVRISNPPETSIDYGMTVGGFALDSVFDPGEIRNGSIDCIILFTF